MPRNGQQAAHLQRFGGPHECDKSDISDRSPPVTRSAHPYVAYVAYVAFRGRYLDGPTVESGAFC